jgi:hypothetical protein
MGICQILEWMKLFYNLFYNGRFSFNFCDIEIFVIFFQEIDNFNQMYIFLNWISPPKNLNVFVEETTKFVEKGIKKYWKHLSYLLNH